MCGFIYIYIYAQDKVNKKEMFYLTTHSTHFIYGYMVSDIWLRTSLIVRKETYCRHIGYSFRLTTRVLLYAPSHIRDSKHHGLCYTSRYKSIRSLRSGILFEEDGVQPGITGKVMGSLGRRAARNHWQSDGFTRTACSQQSLAK